MTDKNAIHGLYVGWALALAMLAASVLTKQPYGFFILLRWICCAAFTYSAFTAYRLNRPIWSWIFAVQAMLFNPIARIHFERSTWQTIDWFSLGSIILAAVVFHKHLRTTQP